MSRPPAAAIVLLGWLAPGGGYLLMRRYARFAVVLLVVCLAFAAGVALQGGILWPSPQELEGIDGFTAMFTRAGALMKALAGAPYFVARFLDYSQTSLAGHLHEYGTTLLVIAGLLNMLTLADALELRKAERR